MKKKLNLKSGAIASVILILGLFICFKYMQVSAMNDIDNEMKNEVSQKIQAWVEYYQSNDKIMKSSNPYSYINNKQFEEIKNLGPEYLPYILREIENTSFAIFALWGLNDITKVKDLPTGDSDVQCVDIWNNYIDSLPLKLNKIKQELYSTTDAKKIKLKTQEIVNLGYPALPLIMEEDNDKIKEVKQYFFKQNINQISYKKSIKDNKEDIKINEEEKINKKIDDYKELMKKNNKIKNLESFKIKRKYK